MTPKPPTPRASRRGTASPLHAYSENAIPNSPGEPPHKRRRYAAGNGLAHGIGRSIDIDDVQEPGETRTPNLRTRLQRDGAFHDSRPSSRCSRRMSTPPAPVLSTRREKQSPRKYQSSATAIARNITDSYKPREEKGWEEFHPYLDIDARLAVFSAEEVDGTAGIQSENQTEEASDHDSATEGNMTDTDLQNESSSLPFDKPPKRCRSRLPATKSLASSNLVASRRAPQVIPIVNPSSNENLTLPKPSCTPNDPFVPFEIHGVGQQNYVDRTMASVGYQESDLFLRNGRGYIRQTEGAAEEDFDLDTSLSEGNPNAAIGGFGVGRVEYDMDEQDANWLQGYNEQRRVEQCEPIKPAVFEITMTKIEKEWCALEKRIPKPNSKPPQTQRPRSSSAAAVMGEPTGGEEQDTKCAICNDGDCENANAIVFCDGCDLAVHQDCYGVPFIPEGQWLCRKCQLIGRGAPNCIFCPNTEGAFKQTTSSRWAHLLCSIWIPEVSLGNPALMEPIIDVEKVPRSRWKLVCYICHQKMGACIQCSNKNCFVAFHATCARRAQLYLKMKPAPGLAEDHDNMGLEAYCDKHVPDEWRADYDLDTATAEAIEYYRATMAGRKWPDSQAFALSLDNDDNANNDREGPLPRITLTVGSNKRKRVLSKAVWKLPSGAPVIPQIILNSVVASLQRFTVRQRKQYAEDACKYWTLKREARRGAALLKRLQLQLETFSSMEMTRRNYAGMGVPGAMRLQRRITFGQHLYTDLDKVRILCDEVKKRERDKMRDAELLRNVVDLVYFPMIPTLWPILDKAISLDSKTRFFSAGFLDIRYKLETRAYGSVTEFSRDLANVFAAALDAGFVANWTQFLAKVDGRAPELSAEVRERRKLAKRIARAVQGSLEEAFKNESELVQKPYEKELKDLESMTGAAISPTEQADKHKSSEQLTIQHGTPIPPHSREYHVSEMASNGRNGDTDAIASIEVPNETSETTTAEGMAPVSVHRTPLSEGGVMWYMKPFDPVGTTFHEERWMGQEVAREMSETLSDIDEEELWKQVEDEFVDHEAEQRTTNQKATAKRRTAAARRRRRKAW